MPARTPFLVPRSSHRRLAGSDGATTIDGELEARGKPLLLVTRDERLVGVLPAAEHARPEIPDALEAVRQLGLHHIELLTGANERVAASVADLRGVAYRANLLPEERSGR